MGVEGLFANWRFAIRYETYYKIIIIKEIKKHMWPSAHVHWLDLS